MAPAVREAIAAGINAEGSLPPDSIFQRGSRLIRAVAAVNNQKTA